MIPENAQTAAETLLTDRGAAEVPHPGGTLLAHLRRVRDLLLEWGSPEHVQLAGLCHAAYGTDGFGVSLLDLDERQVLVQAVGAEAEALVHLYGSCDRDAVYPQLDRPEVGFRNRFTGEVAIPSPEATAAFVEITAANELDVIRHSAELATKHGPALTSLFARAERHLSVPARAAWQHLG